MDSLSMQTQTSWLGSLSNPLRMTAQGVIRGYASFAVVAAVLGGFVPRCVSAGCGCNDCAAQATGTCDTCTETPRICGLGNGLLDYLDKASGRFENHFFRLRGSACSCASKCDASCDGIDCGTEGFSTLSDSGYESHGSIMQYNASPSHSHSEPLQHRHGGSSGSLNESPVPEPIPDPIASPPLNAPSPRKLGNPFTDEARSVPQEEIVAPVKVTYSLRSLGSQELSLARVDVKPVPKHLLRGRSNAEIMKPHDADGQLGPVQSEVITAGSIVPSTSRKGQFAR